MWVGPHLPLANARFLATICTGSPTVISGICYRSHDTRRLPCGDRIATERSTIIGDTT